MSKETLQEEIDELKKIKQSLQMDIIELDDKILFQDFGVYQPQYNFATIDEYKEKLDEIRNKQKEMIKSNTAAICNTAWKVQGSEQAGKKMIAENIKQTLRNFNIECDLCISKVKFSNYDNSKERIFKAFELQNKLNETNDIHIVDEYYRLKNKGAKNVTLEHKIICVQAKTGMTLEEIGNLTIRNFYQLFDVIVDEEEYKINKSAEFNGVQFKEPTEHWAYKEKKDKYAEAFCDADSFSTYVQSAN